MCLVWRMRTQILHYDCGFQPFLPRELTSCMINVVPCGSAVTWQLYVENVAALHLSSPRFSNNDICDRFVYRKWHSFVDTYKMTIDVTIMIDFLTFLVDFGKLFKGKGYCMAYKLWRAEILSCSWNIGLCWESENSIKLFKANLIKYD